jgi:hypothetical protein
MRHYAALFVASLLMIPAVPLFFDPGDPDRPGASVHAGGCTRERRRRHRHRIDGTKILAQRRSDRTDNPSRWRVSNTCGLRGYPRGYPREL